MTEPFEEENRVYGNTDNRSGGTAAPRLLVAGIVVVGLAGIGPAGCDSGSKASDSSSTSSSTQAFTQSGGDLSVDKGETFVIALESNPSTGFVWSVAQAPDSAIVTLEDQTYKKSDSAAPGAPGTERFTFRAAATGTTTIGLKYARPSDPDASDNSNDTYTVTVG